MDAAGREREFTTRVGTFTVGSSSYHVVDPDGRMCGFLSPQKPSVNPNTGIVYCGGKQR